MKHFNLPFVFLVILLLSSCSSEEATEKERTTANFLSELGVDISSQQWWRTAVMLKINVTTKDPVKLWLLSMQDGLTTLYDYKEVSSSGSVFMTVPQGQGNLFTLKYECRNKVGTQEIVLSGKTEEMISLNISTANKAPRRSNRTPPPSLCGSSKRGNADYYEFTTSQLSDYFSMMDLSINNVDAKYVLGLNCNYELESNGAFYITWVNGYEAEQKSRILGYYYHSANTYKDIVYVDLSETHKWDYIDGLAKVQYQFSQDVERGGHLFKANTWYDANFDMNDVYGSTFANNMDRLGDDAYNSQDVFTNNEDIISALRGIHFKIDVPAGMHIGFYLRSDEEPDPEQYELLLSYNIKPNATTASRFKGTCFCAEFMNVEGNGRGIHRSFVKAYDEVIWMGMEDLVNGGDHDCNDVIFGVVADLKILMPTIVDPTDPNADPGPDLEDAEPFSWTIAYEDVNRNADFDFNDAVIKLEPDYDNELCCVTVKAAGSTSRMYLHYDGPNGDENLGEIHELLGSKKTETLINTQDVVANTPFVQIDCVPWPKDYTMGEDAKRFYIEIQRGTCDDCTDIITLANEPGQLPEALLVADGDWSWPMEGVNINAAYTEISKWAQDVTRTRFWEWYQTPKNNTFVSY